MLTLSFLPIYIYIYIASIVVADTCVDDPDSRLLDVTEYYLYDHPIIFEEVQYLLTSKYCRVLAKKMEVFMAF
jgi:hypothetical protein